MLATGPQVPAHQRGQLIHPRPAQVRQLARPAGGPSASSTSRAATSPASTGWTRHPAGTVTTGSLASCRIVSKVRSWN